MNYTFFLVCSLLSLSLFSMKEGEIFKVALKKGGAEFREHTPVLWEHLPKQTQAIIASKDVFEGMKAWVDDKERSKIDLADVMCITTTPHRKTDFKLVAPRGHADKDHMLRGILYMRSFGPISARDYKNMLGPLATHTKSESVIIAPQQFDVSRKDTVQDLWSDEWMDALKVGCELMDSYPCMLKAPRYLVAQAAGVPTALRFLAHNPKKFAAALLINPLADIKQLLEKRPVLRTFFKDIPAYNQEGEEPFLKKRFAVEEWIAQIKTPIMAVFAGQHYGMSPAQLTAFEKMAKGASFACETLTLTGERRDFSEESLHDVLSEWNTFKIKYGDATIRC